MPSTCWQCLSAPHHDGDLPPSDLAEVPTPNILGGINEHWSILIWSAVLRVYPCASPSSLHLTEATSRCVCLRWRNQRPEKNRVKTHDCHASVSVVSFISVAASAASVRWPPTLALARLSSQTTASNASLSGHHEEPRQRPIEIACVNEH